MRTTYELCIEVKQRTVLPLPRYPTKVLYLERRPESLMNSAALGGQCRRKTLKCSQRWWGLPQLELVGFSEVFYLEVTRKDWSNVKQSTDVFCRLEPTEAEQSDEQLYQEISKVGWIYDDPILTLCSYLLYVLCY